MRAETKGTECEGAKSIGRAPLQPYRPLPQGGSCSINEELDPQVSMWFHSPLLSALHLLCRLSQNNRLLGSHGPRTWERSKGGRRWMISELDFAVVGSPQ